MRPFTTFAFLFAALAMVPANAAWPRLPTVESKPVGMETAFAGTALHAVSGIVEPGALVSGDIKKAARLNSGRGEATLKFAKQSIVRNASFINEGLEGKVSLLVSSDDEVWIPMASAVFASADRMVKMNMGRAQGRYVKLAFELSKGGALRGLQLVGSDQDVDYLVTQTIPGTGVPVNFASGIGGGRLVYLSETLPGMGLAAVQSNTLQFTDVTAKIRTAVYDLGQPRALEEFGSAHSPCPVKFSVYAFDKLAEKENWRGRLSFDEAVFAGAKPIAAAEDKAGTGLILIRPPQTVKSRYVALRWEADSAPESFGVFGVTVSGLADVCFKHPDVIATTAAGATGEAVTTLMPGDGRGANTVRSEAGLIAHAQAAMPSGMSWQGSGAVSGPFAARGIGGLGGLRGGARKVEGTEEDPDPEAIHILWCPIASP